MHLIYNFSVFEHDIFVGDQSRVEVSITEAGLLCLKELSRKYFDTYQHQKYFFFIYGATIFLIFNFINIKSA